MAGFRQYSDYSGVSCPPLFPSTDRNGKCQTLIWIFHHYYGRQAHFGQTSPSLTTTRERGVLPKMVAKTPRIFKNLWHCCLEQYSILVSRSLFLVKKRTTDFGCPVKMCIMLYYVRLTRLNLKIILLQSICMQRLQALHIR